MVRVGLRLSQIGLEGVLGLVVVVGGRVIGERKILLQWTQVIPYFLGDSFHCAGGSGFLLLLVRTPPDLGGAKVT